MTECRGSGSGKIVCVESETGRKVFESPDRPITFGSDAHVPQDVGAEFPKAVFLARSCGYTKLCRFTQRHRELVPLG